MSPLTQAVSQGTKSRFAASTTGARPLRSYRLYLLDRGGKVIDSVELSHDCDEAAVAEARAHLRGAPAELWNETGLRHRFPRIDDEF